MAEFNDSHKKESTPLSPPVPTIEWYDEKGNWGPITLTDIPSPDLWAMRNEMERFLRAQLRIIDQELDNWTNISCYVCETEDLAYRGEPFVTWGYRDGYLLCPSHLVKLDIATSPDYAEARATVNEDNKLKEIFG